MIWVDMETLEYPEDINTQESRYIQTGYVIAAMKAGKYLQLINGYFTQSVMYRVIVFTPINDEVTFKTTCCNIL